MSTAPVSVDQHRIVREACGLLDRSERGKLALTGPQAAEFLNGQITNDVLALAPGEGCYAAFLTHKGKMLGDLRVLRVQQAAAGLRESAAVGAEELWLDTERVALQALFDLIRRFQIGYDVALHKRTVERGLLSLVGPRARDVVEAAGAGEGPDTAEHAHVGASIAGHDARLIATDVGVDVICPAEATGDLRTALIAAGAEAVGEPAAEALRVERGRPRWGIDIDGSTIPEEAGLNERAVSFTKGCYVGQETVARLHWRGKPNRHMRGLLLAGDAHAGAEVRIGDRVVGTLGSVATSPVHGTIALSLLRREAEPGDEVAVGEEGVAAAVVELPFR